MTNVTTETKEKMEDVVEVTEEKVNEVNEETKTMAEELKDAVENDEKVNLSFNPRRLLKYALTGFLGASVGVLGKMAYDNSRNGKDTKVVILDPIDAEDVGTFDDSISSEMEF